jgi:hypothetical protein
VQAPPVDIDILDRQATGPPGFPAVESEGRVIDALHGADNERPMPPLAKYVSV